MFSVVRRLVVGYRVIGLLTAIAASSGSAHAQDVFLGVSRPTFSNNTTSVALDPLYRGTLDGDSSFTYEVFNKQDPNQVLSSASIVNGKLVLNRRPGAKGSASVGVRARVSKPFPVLDNIYGKIGIDKPDTLKLGMIPSQILTHYAFFTYNPKNKTYDPSVLNEAFLKNAVHNDINSIYNTVLDIEDETYYGNTTQGRERLGRALSVVRRERPDVKGLGYYMLLPSRKWWEPVEYKRGLAHLEMGLDTYYTQNLPKFRDEYNKWLAANALYRTHKLSDGQTVADKISATYPSLYVPHRDFAYEWGTLIEVSYNASSNSFLTAGCGFQVGSVVNFYPTKPGQLPSPLAVGRKFYVVKSSADNLQFEISNAPGGAPIKLSSGFTTRTYINRINTGRTLCQDADVSDWVMYARENIAEARKYGKPVYPYISPTIEGAGKVSLSGEYWRLQLRTLRDIADGVVIWDGVNEDRVGRAATEWWRETEVFLNSQRPRTMTFIVPE